MMAVTRYGASALLGVWLVVAAAQGRADEPDVKPVSIGKPVAKSKVPPIRAQDQRLPPQSISAVDVSGDGKRIAVTTLAFHHDRNFWLLSDEGKVLWGRYVQPWAPYQVAVTPKGGAFATGLAYS